MIFGRRRSVTPVIGNDVVTSDEEHLGDVVAVNEDAIDVMSTSIDRRVLWRVPRSAISRVEDETVYLTASRGQALARGWEHQPERRASPAPTLAAPAMVSAEPAAVARRIVEEVLNQGNLAAVDDLFAPDFQDHTPRAGQEPGREGYQQAIAALRRAFPDLTYTIEDVIAADDKVVLRLSASGTHQGELAGIAPTGKRVQIVGIVIDRIVGGRLVERWGLGDDLDLLRQLGIVTPPVPMGS